MLVRRQPLPTLQLPLNRSLRDTIRFEPLTVRVLESFTPTAEDIDILTERGAGTGMEAGEAVQRRVGQGTLPLARLLDSQLHKNASGSPSFAVPVRIPINRESVPYEAICCNETPVYAADDFEAGSVPRHEFAEVLVDVTMNVPLEAENEG